MARETKAMEKLVNSLDELLNRMREQQRQYEIQIALLQKNDFQIIQLYPDEHNEDDSGFYEI